MNSGEACGHLFEQSGVCLGCEIDWQDTTVLAYEATEADRFWGQERSDARGEMSAPTCGID